MRLASVAGHFHLLQLAAQIEDIKAKRSNGVLVLRRTYEDEVPDLQQHVMYNKEDRKSRSGKCPQELSWTPGNTAPQKRGKHQHKRK